MPIVSVTGAGPGIGKTAVVEMLLQATHGAHAVRVRVAEEIGKAHAEVVSEAGFYFLPDEEASDHAAEIERLKNAGAAGVSVLLAMPHGLEAGLTVLTSRLPRGADLIVEGNGYLWARRADLAIMVIGAGPSGKGLVRVRQSVREIFPKIDIWTWNTRTDAHEEGFFEFPQALVRMGFTGTVSNAADFHDVKPHVANYAGNMAFIDCIRNRLSGRGRR
jgi:NAD(P)-dependent dehydrogenase (short-subunit alcohol dehydrogenase family)